MTVAVPTDSTAQARASRRAAAAIMGFDAASESRTARIGRLPCAKALGLATEPRRVSVTRRALAEAINLALSVKAPRNLTFDDQTNTLSWDAPDWLVPTTYRVRVSRNGGSTWTVLAADTSATSIVDAAHTAATAYEVTANTNAGLATGARLGGDAYLSSVTVEGPATVVENTTATFRCVIGAGSVYDSVTYAWQVRAAPENHALGTVTVAGDMMSITYAANEISLDRLVTVTCTVTARGDGTTANADSEAIDTGTLNFTQDHVPSALDPSPPGSVVLDISGSTATVTVTWPNDNPDGIRDGWGVRVTKDDPSPTAAPYVGDFGSTPNAAAATTDSATSDDFLEPGTYYAHARARSGTRRSAWETSAGVEVASTVTTETQYAYRRAAALPTLPTSTAEALPSGWAAASPGAAVGEGVYRIARDVTRDGGDFDSATAWAWDPAQASQPWTAPQSAALTVRIAGDGGNGPLASGASRLFRSVVGGTATGTIGYQWSISGAGTIVGGVTARNISARANTVTANSSFTLSLTVTRGGHTATAASVTIPVTGTGLGTLTVSISGPSRIDEGAQGTFTASVGGTATGAISYSWTVRGSVEIVGSSTGSSVTVEGDSITRDSSFGVTCSVSRGGVTRSAARSGTVRADTTASRPPAPTGLQVSVTETTRQGDAIREWRVSLSWTSGGGSTTRFLVAVPGSGSTFTTSTSRSVTRDSMDGATPGGSSTATVTAYNGNVQGGSVSASFTYPG